MMQGLTQEEERFKVLLMGIEEDTVEHRKTFCTNVSKRYNLSFALLRDVIDRCPIVLRKNISLQKADALARALKQFGALVSVEGSNNAPSIRLEFQDLGPPVLALEDSRFRKKHNGMWSVTGKVKNISAANVTDLWVLVQFFGPDRDLITFEEVPIPINPLPPRMSSPFKVLFEGSTLVTSISIAFKAAEGTPLSASDGRQVERLTPEKPAEADPARFPDTAELQANPEVTLAEGGTPQGPKENLQTESPSSPDEDFVRVREGAEAVEPMEVVPTAQDSDVSEPQLSEEPPVSRSSAEVPSGLERRDVEMIGIVFPELDTPSSIEKTTEEGAPEEVSPLEEASQILGEISDGDQGSSPREETRGKIESASAVHVEQTSPHEGKELPAVPWIEPFRHSVDAFYGHHPDPFCQWFQRCQEEKRFESELHALMTILLHARFDQMTPSEKALENTERAYPLVTRPSLAVEDIPALEGTLHFPDDHWRKLLHKAVPRLREVAQNILARQCWSVTDLEQWLQVIPHMSRQTSRRATKWIRTLMAGTVQIDLSQARVLIGETLYRVAARLGVVEPQFDGCEGSDSLGDIKIQSFAKTAFPEDVLRIEEPMEWVGSPPEEEGHCAPLRPRCEGCLFEAFCSRLHAHADPCEKRMKKTH